MVFLNEFRDLDEAGRRVRVREYGAIHFADGCGRKSFCGVRSPRNWMTPDGRHGETVATWICGNCQNVQRTRERRRF
jgi:hypothetical protein